MFAAEEVEDTISILLRDAEHVSLSAVSEGVLLPIHYAWLRGTPLHWAVSCRNKEAVVGLLRAGSNPNLVYEGYSALALAAELHSYEISELLLSAQADVHDIGPFKRSALHFAAGSAPIVKRKVIHGEKCGKAAKRTIQILVKHGCKINAQDKAANTPLHKAAASPFERGWDCGFMVVDELLRHGADRNVQNNDGDTPLHLAVILSRADNPNHEALLEKLMDNSPAVGAKGLEPLDLNLHDRNGRSCILLAAFMAIGPEFMAILLAKREGQNEAIERALSSKDKHGLDHDKLSQTRDGDVTRFFEEETHRLQANGLGVDLKHDCS